VIYSATVKELKRGEVHPNSPCRVIVVKGRMPFRCKKKIDIDARRLYPNDDLMKEFLEEEKKFHFILEGTSTGRVIGSLEKAFNLTRFESRYRRQILSDSESISLIRRIKKANQDSKSWPMGITIISEWPDRYPIMFVLQSLINSSIGDQ